MLSAKSPRVNASHIRSVIWLSLLIGIVFWVSTNNRYKLTVLYRFYTYLSMGCPSAQALPLYKTIDYKVDFYGLTFEGTSDSEIDRNILYFGAHEKHILFMMRDLLRNLGPDSVVWDVGANIGQHSLFLSKYAAHVHSFEPYPPVLERMQRVVDLNSISNIYIHPVGLGASTEVLPFFPPTTDNLGTGSFVMNDNSNPTEQVLKIVKGDEFFAEHGLNRLDLVKIDTEGFEKPVLQGLRNTLIQYRPIIVLEMKLGEALSFQNEEDFFGSLPQDYLLFSFASEDLMTGSYELAEASYSLFKIPGSLGHYTAILSPKEKLKFLSLETQEQDPHG